MRRGRRLGRLRNATFSAGKHVKPASHLIQLGITFDSALNRDFGEWLAVFSNPLMGSAAMDRLVHRGIKFIIEGKSYRVDSFIKRSRTLTEEAKAV